MDVKRFEFNIRQDKFDVRYLNQRCLCTNLDLGFGSNLPCWGDEVIHQ